MSKIPFDIDVENKQFVFSARNYEELFIETSYVHKTFKAAMALGCYNGFVPVLKKDDNNDSKKDEFNEDGVITWLKANNPEWLNKWEAAKAVRTASNEPFPFMVRKNYFLYENAGARGYCGMKEPKKAPKKTEENPDCEVYWLKPKAKVLRSAVENYLEKQDK